MPGGIWTKFVRLAVMIKYVSKLVEIRSVTSEIGRRNKMKKKEETTAVKYKPLGIAMPCGL